MYTAVGGPANDRPSGRRRRATELQPVWPLVRSCLRNQGGAADPWIPTRIGWLVVSALWAPQAKIILVQVVKVVISGRIGAPLRSARKRLSHAAAAAAGQPSWRWSACSPPGRRRSAPTACAAPRAAPAQGPSGLARPVVVLAGRVAGLFIGRGCGPAMGPAQRGARAARLQDEVALGKHECGYVMLFLRKCKLKPSDNLCKGEFCCFLLESMMCNFAHLATIFPLLRCPLDHVCCGWR